MEVMDPNTLENLLKLGLLIVLLGMVVCAIGTGEGK
jgi:hypothetical protein